MTSNANTLNEQAGHPNVPGADQPAVHAEEAPSLVLTVDEVADILRISRGLAFAAVRAGTIPHIRIGRRILVPRTALTSLLET